MLKSSQLGRVAIYYRTSSDEQKEGRTVEAQRSYARDWCRRREIRWCAEFVDDGVSGESEITSRDGGTAMHRAAGRREFDTLLVFAVDRLGRTAYYCLHAFHILRQLGVRIISATEEFDPDESTGKLIIALLAGKSESDKHTIYLRTESGKASFQAEPDFYVGGVVPYGYMLEWRGRRKYYVICRKQIPGCDCTPEDVILFIFRRCLDEVTCHVIAQELNALGIPTCWVPGDRRYDTPSRSQWHAERVAKILRNPFYRGVQMIGAPGKGNVVKRSEPLIHQVPAIVDAETMARAAAVLTQNRTMADRNATQFYLLRSKIICLTCGKHYCGTPRVSAYLPRGRYYRCCKSVRYQYCTSHWIDAAELEAQVKHDIDWILHHTQEFVAELKQRLGDDSGQLELLLSEAERHDQARQNLGAREMEYYRMRAEGLIPSDDKLRELLAELTQRAATLATQAEALRGQAQALAAADGHLRDAQAVLMEYSRRAEQGFTDEEWRALVHRLVDRIEVETTGERRKKRAIAHVYYRVSHTVNLTSRGGISKDTLARIMRSSLIKEGRNG